MSKVTRFVCDRCGKDVPDDKRIGYIDIGWQDEDGIHTEADRLFGGYGLDFCEDCIQDVLRFATEAPAEERGPKPGPKEKKIDEGKMLALYKAGWTQRQIAEELGIPQTTVSYRLKKLGATEGGQHES